MRAKRLPERVRCLMAVRKRHECRYSLAFQVIGLSDDGGFGDGVVRNERRFYLGRSEPMAADVYHVIDTSHYPQIAALIAACAVAREIAVFVFRPIRSLIALFVAPNSAKHRRPRLTYH